MVVNLKISQMPSVVELEGDEAIPLVQGGLNKTTTPDQLRVFVASGEIEVVAAAASLAPTGITDLQSGASSVNVLLPVGVNGVEKTLVASAVQSPITVSVPHGRGFNQLSITATGSSAALVFVNGNWFIKCLRLTTAQAV